MRLFNEDNEGRSVTDETLIENEKVNKPVEEEGYGYYHADRAAVKRIMRPSATLNGILAEANS